MIENMGFWLWLLMMLFIVVVLGSLTVLVLWSERRGYNRPKLPPEQPIEPSERLEVGETHNARK